MYKRLLPVALLLALATPSGTAQSAGKSFAQRLTAARELYFKDLEGDRSAQAQARTAFATLCAERPGDTTARAYSGSIELLDAARTWAVWNKRTLAREGLRKMDSAVAQAPDDLEARFVRAASVWHLPFFYKRHDQAADDFSYIAPRAERAVRSGTLPPQLAAAALDYYGQVLIERSDRRGARQAFATAVRIDGASPAGRDASRRLGDAE